MACYGHTYSSKGRWESWVLSKHVQLVVEDGRDIRPLDAWGLKKSLPGDEPLQNQEAASLFTNMFTSSSEKRVRPKATAASCRTLPETIPLRTPSRALSVSAVWSTWLSRVCCVSVLSKSRRSLPDLSVTTDPVEYLDLREFRDCLDSSEDTVGSEPPSGLLPVFSPSEAHTVGSGLPSGLLQVFSPCEAPAPSGAGTGGSSETRAGWMVDISTAGGLLGGGWTTSSSSTTGAVVGTGSASRISARTLLSKVRDRVGFFFIADLPDLIWL